MMGFVALAAREADLARYPAGPATDTTGGGGLAILNYALVMDDRRSRHRRVVYQRADGKRVLLRTKSSAVDFVQLPPRPSNCHSSKIGASTVLAPRCQRGL